MVGGSSHFSEAYSFMVKSCVSQWLIQLHISAYNQVVYLIKIIFSY